MILTEIVQIAVASYFQERSVPCTYHSDAGFHIDVAAAEDDDDVAAVVAAYAEVAADGDVDGDEGREKMMSSSSSTYSLQSSQVLSAPDHLVDCKGWETFEGEET